MKGVLLMRRRMLSLSVLALLLLPTTAQAGGAPVPADAQTHWARTVIETGVRRGWINGFPDGSFRPDAPITRAEFYKLLAVAMQVKPEPGWAPFVELDHWSVRQGWIPAAVHTGLIEPSDYVGFRLEPDRELTRQELIMAAVRATGFEGLIGSLPATIADQTEIPEWLRPWASLAVQEGLISGFPDHSLRVTAGTSRAEALTVINRIVDRLTLQLTPAAKVPAGQQYGPGEPFWSEAGWDGFHPLIQSVAGLPSSQPVNPVTGHETYTLPEYARGIQLLPAPGAEAWLRYTIDGATPDESYDIFALLSGGQIQEVRRQPFREGQFQNGLAVEASGALLFLDGSTISRLQPDGTTQRLAENLPLGHAVLDDQGALWGDTADGTQLVRVSPTGEVSRIALPVTPFGQSISQIIPAPEGDLWLLRWDQTKRQTDALRIEEGAVTETLLLMPARTHGSDAMPVRVTAVADQSAWIERQQQTGPATWESTALYRFDLRTGAFQPALAPEGVKGPLEVAGSSEQGALLVDRAGHYWQLTR